MKNVLKLVFLGVVGIFALTYLTVSKPEIKANEVSAASLASLPAKYELVGKEGDVSKDSLFKANTRTLIVVGNHDSLAVVKELPKHFDVQIPYVMVANISSAPWFVKKLFIPGKLEELNEGSNIPMIYDFEGDTVKALNVTENAKTKFAAFIIEADGSIKKIFNGEVKEGALDGTMNDEEKKAALAPLAKLL